MIAMLSAMTFGHVVPLLRITAANVICLHGHGTKKGVRESRARRDGRTGISTRIDPWPARTVAARQSARPPPAW
jgi:hypothetical protein